MKRFTAFLFILAIFALIPLGVSKSKVDADIKRVTFVTEEMVELSDASVVKSGNDYYVTVPSENAAEMRKKLKNIKGYVCYYDKAVSEEKILSLLDFKLSEQNIVGVRVLTGYTSVYKDWREVGGKKVNIQIAFTEDEVIVGYPLILTGF